MIAGASWAEDERKLDELRDHGVLLRLVNRADVTPGVRERRCTPGVASIFGELLRPFATPTGLLLVQLSKAVRVGASHV
jgi:hypothetical protein